MIRFNRRSSARASLVTLSWLARGAARTSATISSIFLPQRQTKAAEPAPSRVTADQVERAIRNGVSFLKSQQLPDGSWPNPHLHHQHTVGPTSLVAHALIVAGVPKDAPAIMSALGYLERFTPEEVDGNYAVGLQTMVYCEVDPKKYAVRIAANVDWAERAQVQPGDKSPGFQGSWAHTSDKTRRGDNSSSQFAMLGLNAAAAAGFPVKQEVWERYRKFLLGGQRSDGGWPYYPSVWNSVSTGSMTCAGLSGLLITGQHLPQASGERLVGDEVKNCGREQVNPSFRRGLEWLASRFTVTDNPGGAFFRQWHHYFLYGVERVARLSGQRLIGSHDWYRLGAEYLVANQDVLRGAWIGVGNEREQIIATSLALLFLATGRSPVLINKLVHGPGNDWNNDINDVRNLVDLISAGWKHTLTWQTTDPDQASVEDLLLAPIAYLNGHDAPVLTARAKETLRAFIDQGGFLIAEACCGDERFDRGFRALIRELFPEAGMELRPLDDSHAVWRAYHTLSPDIHPLWGLERGCRTSVIYTPKDLSCYWNQMASNPAHASVIKAARIGRNIIDYATGRELPADKLAAREISIATAEPPRRGSLRIGKLRHAGDWNIAPLAIPNLSKVLRDRLNLDVEISQKEIAPTDPGLVYYPLLYMHGRADFSFEEADLVALRQHFSPGLGTLFADAACGRAAFDTAFRRFAAALFPGNPLVAIPHDDPFFSTKTAYDLTDVKYSEAAGGGHGYPPLEGIKVDDRWAVIYSRIDLGCTLQRHAGLDCKAYKYESALRIAANIVVYAMTH